MSLWNVPVILGVEHGFTNGVELKPEFVAHIMKYEEALSAWFNKDLKYGTFRCSVGGRIVDRQEWHLFLKRRDYYTSPLYKALL